MSSEWPEIPLSEVCEIRPAKRQSKETLSDSDDVSFVPMEDLPIGGKYLSASKIKPLGKVYSGYTYFSDGDVLLAKITPCFQNGKLAIARDLMNGVGFGSSEFFIFRPSEMVNAEFLFYFLSRKNFREDGVAKMSGAVGHQRVPKEFIEDLPIPIPPLSEQKRIVAILDEAFGAIARAKENAARNLANARELFDSYLNRVFTEKGEGWEEKTLENVCSLITDGKHGNCKDEEGSGYYFLSAKDIKDDCLNYDKAREITKADFLETHRRTNLEPGDIVLTNAGTIGRTALATSDEKTFRTTFQKSVAILKPIHSIVNGRFLLFGLKTKLIELIKLSAGTAQKNLLLRDTRKFKLPMPVDLQLQQQIAEQIADTQIQCLMLERNYQQKLASLDELKQSLLQKAFTGQLTSKPKELELVP